VGRIRLLRRYRNLTGDIAVLAKTRKLGGNEEKKKPPSSPKTVRLRGYLAKEHKVRARERRSQPTQRKRLNEGKKRKKNPYVSSQAMGDRCIRSEASVKRGRAEGEGKLDAVRGVCPPWF